jgi:hypothetical protein
MATAKSATQSPSTRQDIRHSESSEFAVSRDLLDYFKEYAREKPEVAALWCFGLGFILGWKLKPW